MTDGPKQGGVARGVTSLGVHNQIDHKNRPASTQLHLQEQVQIKEKLWSMLNAMWQGISSRHSI